ncbi:hypothetical protein AAFF_G00095450 [Aldrovandia affinis]|uniref:Immunoglobulin V-set domain-containing protein n=1 Tax=Aldrovandia affinis TaxID=143900 RepID=A0AAD7R3F1_9TELE|nr:hypothetical protein AAFF_G00095450 [Aldrovandia affinis]
MLHVLCLLLFDLSNANSVSGSVVFCTPGESATVRYECSVGRDCYGQFIEWVRITSNGPLQIIDTNCEKSPCRFTSKTLNNSQAELTIAQVEPGDSGRYFSGDHLTGYLEFGDVGTVLQVGDVWMNHSEVLMLMEWMSKDGKQELDQSNIQTSNSSEELMLKWMYKTDINSELGGSDFPDVKRIELRCVVTGLSAPRANVLWHSSQGARVETGQTWSLAKATRGYRLESRLRIGVKPGWEDEYDYPHHRSKDMDLDRIVEMDEELWCEVQVGVNSSVISSTFSFLQETHTKPEGCLGLLWAGIAVCVLCVCLLTMLTCHCLCQHTGSALPATEASPTFDSHRDVTYAQLDIKKQPRTKRQSRQKDQQSDRLVYSEVRHRCE